MLEVTVHGILARNGLKNVHRQWLKTKRGKRNYK